MTSKDLTPASLELFFTELDERTMTNTATQITELEAQLAELKTKLKHLDQRFDLPPVLGPYRTLCSVKYEGVSIASSYNQILQLFFSGRTDLLTTRQRKWLNPYPSL